MVFDALPAGDPTSGDRDYLLLTGATGLLGRYLLRNLLANYTPVAVLARGNRISTAEARVESLVKGIEESLRHSLPRPVVLSGDLSRPGLGLDPDGEEWVRRHVGAVLHNAASLSFQDGQRHEEPWLTNVTGTQNLLEMCAKTEVRQFHHVSTAYVCGQRTGRVLETERNVGQAFGNDYERSKIEAEEMVARHGFDSLTIYRPAIIVGDSQTGFTSTYHGFYTPLHIAHAMINKISVRDVEVGSLTNILGLEGSERKNLVPVDWVAAVIAYLALAPEHHGRTYHLTPREPTPVSLLSEVFVDSILEHSVDWDRVVDPKAAQNGLSFDYFRDSFHSQMTTYRAYWRDDPDFDNTNTLEHAPHLPCPTLDRNVLRLLCQYAIDRKFSATPLMSPPRLFDVFSFLRTHVPESTNGNGSGAGTTLVNLRVSGSGGGEWHLSFDEQHRLRGVAPGRAGRGVADVVTSEQCLRGIDSGDYAWDTLMKAGGITLENVAADPGELQQLLRNAFSSAQRLIPR